MNIDRPSTLAKLTAAIQRPTADNCTLPDPRRPEEQFPHKLHRILEDAEENGFSHIISWMPDGTCFKIFDKIKLEKVVMPLYFTSRKFRSFQRSLNLWGFSSDVHNDVDETDEHFIRLPSGIIGLRYHRYFVRGKPDLCFRMARIRVKQPGTRRAKKMPLQHRAPLMQLHQNTRHPNDVRNSCRTKAQTDSQLLLKNHDDPITPSSQPTTQSESSPPLETSIVTAFLAGRLSAVPSANDSLMARALWDTLTRDGSNRSSTTPHLCPQHQPVKSSSHQGQIVASIEALQLSINRHFHMSQARSSSYGLSSNVEGSRRVASDALCRLAEATMSSQDIHTTNPLRNPLDLDARLKMGSFIPETIRQYQADLCAMLQLEKIPTSSETDDHKRIGRRQHRGS